MDFGADADQLKDLASELEGNASEMESIIEDIYSKVNSLGGNSWSGTGYDEFKAECDAYSEALKKIPGVIRDFATFFKGTAATNATDLHGKAVEGKGMIS